MNFVAVDGIVGKIDRKESTVFVRVNHKETFFNKRSNQWEHDENWMTVAFFGKRADAAEGSMKIGNQVLIEGFLQTYPKEGPGVQIRLHGRTFHILQPYTRYSYEKSKTDEPEVDTF